MSDNASRREFLSGAASAMAAPLLAAAPLGKATAPGPHLGCVTYRLLETYDLETIITLLEKTGFEGVELRTEGKHGVEPSISQAERARVRKRFEASKIKLLSFGTTTEFHSPDAAERRRNVEIAKTFVDLARDTGAIGVKVRPNGWGEGVSHDVTIQNIGAALHELGDYGAERGIQIWLEVHGAGTALAVSTAAIMRAAAHKNVGLTNNCAETDIVNGSVKEHITTLMPWMRTIHLKDIGATAYPYPWRELFNLLRAAGFTGWELCESPPSCETERYLRWYKTLWTEFNRPAA